MIHLKYLQELMEENRKYLSTTRTRNCIYQAINEKVKSRTIFNWWEVMVSGLSDSTVLHRSTCILIRSYLLKTRTIRVGKGEEEKGKEEKEGKKWKQKEKSNNTEAL